MTRFEMESLTTHHDVFRSYANSQEIGDLDNRSVGIRHHLLVKEDFRRGLLPSLVPAPDVIEIISKRYFTSNKAFKEVTERSIIFAAAEKNTCFF